MYIAIISVFSNVVLSIVFWGQTFAEFSPPVNTYAIEIPSGVLVNVGDSYNTGTSTFSNDELPSVTPTPIPPGNVGNCVGANCYGTSYTGGSSLTLWSSDGTGASVSFFIDPALTGQSWSGVLVPSVGNAYYGGTIPLVKNDTSYNSNVAQGDLIYATSKNLFERLPKNTTATRYLSNTGTSNNPAWAQVDLTNGVTGTLPVGSGGTGNTTGLAATSTALATNPTDCGANTYATAIDASGNLTCAQVDLINGSTGTLPVGRGGTGNTTGLATGFVTDPADCASNRYATAINASGVLTCAQVSLSAGVTGTLPVGNGGTGAAPGADDQVFVSSSMSAGAWAAVPNCADSGGNHLNYTASTNSFSCGTSSSASPSVESDLTCDGTGAVNTTTATTVLNLPTFNNTGKTTVISGAISINQSAAGAARTYSVDVRLAGTTKITFTGKTESATSKITIPFHWVDSTCGSSCAYTITVTSDSTTGTQTATDCAVSRVSY